MAYLEVKNIYKSYDGKNVLSNVSMQINKGERFGLIGPNGAGKTTLIDIITGLIKADEGEVFLDGMSIKNNVLKIREKLGLVPQDIALLEDLNAYSNLEYFGGMYGLSGKKLKAKIEELLEVTGLTESAKKKVKTYSGGMKRRLNIAAALLHDPEFLILDEPTVGVDPQSRKYIFDFLKSLNERGTTILYISHYMEEIEALCDRLYVLDLGREVAYGSKEEVKNLARQSGNILLEVDFVPKGFEKLLLESNNSISNVETDFNKLKLTVNSKEFSVMKLIKSVEDTDAVIKSLSVEELSLEETFLQLTGKNLRD